MTAPVEITFNGVEKSEAIEARIAERAAALERRFARMTHCRVVVEAPHRRSKLGKLFHVQIEIGVPGHTPLVVRSGREENHEHEDLSVAIRDAFGGASAAGREGLQAHRSCKSRTRAPTAGTRFRAGWALSRAADRTGSPAVRRGG